MKKEKKILKGKKENDPEWIQNISCYFFTYKKNEKSDEFKKELHDLFLEYKKEGMEPNKAWYKARKVMDCFEME